MKNKIESLRKSFDAALAACTTTDDAAGIRIQYLGRKGMLAALTKELSGAAKEDKPALGQAINAAKKHIEEKLLEKEKTIKPGRDEHGAIDVTLDAAEKNIGSLHPLTKTLQGITEIFMSLGFRVADGPEIETEFMNFEALNIPLDHPSRDAFDTFYLDDTHLLRSHTSTVQIHIMQQEKPPVQAIMPGRVYRPDALDAAHSFMFHQVEGLMVDRGITFADLKGVINLFAKRMFGDGVRLRFRPSFFPFTEPSAEVDISCFICDGRGCRVCSKTGWLEILGAGMVNPKVFLNVGYDPRRYTGFAFGMGV
ncbi:MAG: phenylalanine--tRNA ligase subunit alpha, partial [Candidatus Omnitrophica bacterium]|nr:phenylalanine--tRNA ligase subunit alpha [Candidatus Omnitrophota bacterium]